MSQSDFRTRFLELVRLGRLMNDMLSRLRSAEAIADVDEVLSWVCLQIGMESYHAGFSFPAEREVELGNLALDAAHGGGSRALAEFRAMLDYSRAHLTPLLWSNGQATGASAESKVLRILSHSIPVEIASGVTLPVHHAANGGGLITFWSSMPLDANLDRLQVILPHLHFLAHHIFEAACRADARGKDHQATPRFTAREEECLALCQHGKTSKEIARELGISDATVVFHVRNIKRKLGVHRKVEAVAIVAHAGLCSGSLKSIGASSATLISSLPLRPVRPAAIAPLPRPAPALEIGTPG